MLSLFLAEAERKLPLTSVADGHGLFLIRFPLPSLLIAYIMIRPCKLSAISCFKNIFL